MNTIVEFERQECIQCHVCFMVPKGFTGNRRSDGRTFWCPNGHQMTYGDTDMDRMRRERDRLAQKVAEKEDDAKKAWSTANDYAERAKLAGRRVTALKGQVTKIKKRAAHGVCPCCNRQFSDLARHMAGKHPDFVDQPMADAHVH